MSSSSNIAWTNATWNPIRGCTRLSPGCVKCYAEILAARHSYQGGWGEGLATWVKRPDGSKEARWTGKIQHVEKMLDAPLRWKEPRMIFVNSMSDLFHEDVEGDFIDAILDVIRRCNYGGIGHVFQVLTKRAARMHDFLQYYKPLPNLWLGVSAERQEEFDERVPLLLDTPAAVRWVSLEPLLGHIDLIGKDRQQSALHAYEGRPRLDWGVVGGESGSRYRPMDMAHARYIIEQFVSAGVPLFVKQDNGNGPGMKGRFSNQEWALKGYPA